MNNNLSKLFKNKVILVTGGTGSIGSEIVRQLLQYKPSQIRIYSRDESKHYAFLLSHAAYFEKNILCSIIGDVRDRERLSQAMRGVDIVFHAAALKHAGYCEKNPFEAIKTNVGGAQNVIELAIQNSVERVVAISSDKAVYPNTTMGITKLMMERFMTSNHEQFNSVSTKFSVVRFGNVLNSRGSVIPTWIEQIKNNQPVSVTDKRMKRFFMSIPQAVGLVFTAMSTMHGREIFVLKMKEQSIYELAQKVIAEHGQGKKIEIKFTGLREKEKLNEVLFTEEERETMLENEQFFIILPDLARMSLSKSLYKGFDRISV